MNSRSKLVERVEHRRLALRLSQTDLAARCGISQGHYSKVAKGLIEPGSRTETALGLWLKGARAATSGAREARIAELASTLAEGCAELAGLLGVRQSRGTRRSGRDGGERTD